METFAVCGKQNGATELSLNFALVSAAAGMMLLEESELLHLRCPKDFPIILCTDYFSVRVLWI